MFLINLPLCLDKYCLQVNMKLLYRTLLKKKKTEESLDYSINVTTLKSTSEIPIGFSRTGS